MTIVIVSSLVGLGLILYVVYVLMDAYTDVKTAPRADMYECPKGHGLFPTKYTYKLTGVTEEPMLCCPMCYEDRFKKAKGQ